MPNISAVAGRISRSFVAIPCVCTKISGQVDWHALKLRSPRHVVGLRTVLRGLESDEQLVAGAFAAGLVCSMCGFGAGVAAAEGDDNGGAGVTNLNVGGAKVPNVPWYDYTYRVGSWVLPRRQ